jgi:nickel-dependent lactate racemase
MGGKNYRVPFGKEWLEFSLPVGMSATMAVSKPSEPIVDVEAAIRNALQNPVGARQLRQQARKGDRVCIVFTDITRASPDHLLVPALLDELAAAGVRDEDITLLCGIGMHRPSTLEEKLIKLGEEIVRHYRVIDNEPQNPAALVDLGVTAGGVPVQVHRAAFEADLLVATGIVEPHQYAG